MEDKKAMSPASLEALRRFRDAGGKRKHFGGERRPVVAIRLNCQECCGDSDPALCSIGDCYCWEWRFGSHYKKPRNIERVKSAFARRKLDAAELRTLGLDLPFFTAMDEKARRKALSDLELLP